MVLPFVLACPTPAIAGRLSSYEWSLMVKLQEAEAAGDIAATVPILKELISIEEPFVERTGFADDAGIPAEWKGTIQAAVNAGLVKGLENNRFAPSEPMTRAEACVVALRSMRYLENRGT